MSEETVNVEDPVTGETVDVPAHKKASETPLIPALKWSETRLKHEIGGEENLPDPTDFPVLLTSNFSTDPVEGQQGSYRQLTAFAEDNRLTYDECPNCGYDRATISVKTMPGLAIAGCHLCDWSEEI